MIFSICANPKGRLYLFTKHLQDLATKTSYLIVSKHEKNYHIIKLFVNFRL